MSVMRSANRFEKDALLVFRDSGLAGVTSSGGSTGAVSYSSAGVYAVATGYIPLDMLSAYWDINDNANSNQFAVVCQLEALTTASGVASVSFKVRMDSDTAFSSPAAVIEDSQSVAALTSPGRVILTVTKEQIADALVTLAVGSTTATPVYMDVYMTLSGTTTTPSVVWNAYAAPLLGN